MQWDISLKDQRVQEVKASCTCETVDRQNNEKSCPSHGKRLGSAKVKSKQDRKDSEIRTAASKLTDNLVLFPLY